MLKTLILSAPITPVMANYIVHNKSSNMKFEKSKYSKGFANTYSSSDLAPMGIPAVNVWFNTAKMVSESFGSQNCLLNIVVDVQRDINIDDIIANTVAMLPDYPTNFLGMFVKDLVFKVKGATFVYNFHGTRIKDYYYLLKGGYDLPHMKKDISESLHRPSSIYTTEYSGLREKENPKYPERYKEALHITIQLYKRLNEVKADSPIEYITEYKKTDRLHIKLNLKGNKIFRICHQLDIDFKPETFLEKADEIDSFVFHDYMKSITGEGKFYSFKEAEKIIDSTTYFTLNRKLSVNRKYLMHDVLKSLTYFDTVSEYLDHVEDESPLYSCMRSVRKKQKAKSILKDLELLGISVEDFSSHMTNGFSLFQEANQIIYDTYCFTEKKLITHKQKALMKEALKGVASYKSISSYLDHVEDTTPTYACMNSIRKRSRALSVLRDLQRLGICPLNLSVRSKMNELNSLVQVYEEAVFDTH